jgi:hypothetical protein
MTLKERVMKKAIVSGYPNLTEKEKTIYNSTDMRQIILDTAKSCMGKRMSPIYRDCGCMEAVNAVVMLAIGNPIGGGGSTYLGYQALKTDKRFKEQEAPLPGDVVVSPSGYGNGKIKNGHIGIFSDTGKIMSNNSDTLKWDDKWELGKWIDYYGKKGGFPVDFFRVLS